MLQYLAIIANYYSLYCEALFTVGYPAYPSDSLASCNSLKQDKKAVLSQRWPRDARYK